MIKLKPINNKIKSKIGQVGDRWLVVKESKSVIALGGPGFLIVPEDPKHADFLRWVPPEAVGELD